MAVSIRSALIDEFGDLYAESKRWAAKEKRFEALKIIIREWYPDSDLPVDQATLAEGTRYEIQVGERTIEKTWKSLHAVYKAAGGLKPFLLLCDVTFKALSEKLGAGPAAGLQQEARTGNRKLTAVARSTEAVELPLAA